MSYLVIGIISHTVTGAVLAWLFPSEWSWLYIGLGYAFKESGELKYKIEGSIKTLHKKLRIIEELIFEPTVLLQWALPAAAAYAVQNWIL